MGDDAAVFAVGATARMRRRGSSGSAIDGVIDLRYVIDHR
jgi:hypothetical protein